MARFTVESRFEHTTLEAFERALSDPELYPRLERAMPGVETIEVLSRDEDAREIRRRVRYTPRVGGKLPSFARGVVKPAMLRWVEETTFDKARHRFEYRIVPALPEAWRDRFDSHGSVQLSAAAGGVARHLEGEIVVRVPLLGRTVEKLLVREVTDNFRAEAAALTQLLAERRV